VNRQIDVEESKYGITADTPPPSYLHIVKGLRDLLFEFWDPSLSRERFELETSNLARRLTTTGTKDK